MKPHPFSVSSTGLLVCCSIQNHLCKSPEVWWYASSPLATPFIAMRVTCMVVKAHIHLLSDLQFHFSLTLAHYPLTQLSWSPLL